MPVLSRIPTGLRYMVLAAFYFSLMGLLVKTAGQHLPPSEMVLARSVIALLLTYWMLRRANVTPWGNRKGLLFFRGLAGFMGLLCVFYSLTKLPLADATVIQYTNPVLTAILAALFLKESIGRREFLGLLSSMTGVILVAQPSFFFGATAHRLDLFAVGIALAGAAFSAIAYTTVRKLRETEHHLVVVFYFPLVAAPASIPVMVPEAVWPSPLDWCYLIGIGICTQIAQVYLTKGLHLEKAGRAMSMSYVQIVFAALWGFFFFQEVLDPLSLFGAVLVVAGTLLVARRR
ncbi:MAG: DMT family transporter [Rhodothermales bacterium]